MQYEFPNNGLSSFELPEIANASSCHYSCKKKKCCKKFEKGKNPCKKCPKMT